MRTGFSMILTVAPPREVKAAVNRGIDNCGEGDQMALDAARMLQNQTFGQQFTEFPSAQMYRQ